MTVFISGYDSLRRGKNTSLKKPNVNESQRCDSPTQSVTMPVSKNRSPTAIPSSRYGKGVYQSVSPTPEGRVSAPSAEKAIASKLGMGSPLTPQRSEHRSPPSSAKEEVLPDDPEAASGSGPGTPSSRASQVLYTTFERSCVGTK